MDKAVCSLRLRVTLGQQVLDSPRCFDFIDEYVNQIVSLIIRRLLPRPNRHEIEVRSVPKESRWERILPPVSDEDSISQVRVYVFVREGLRAVYQGIVSRNGVEFAFNNYAWNPLSICILIVH